MLNRFAVLSAIVMVSWCVLLANVSPFLTALAVLCLAGGIGGLYLVLTESYRYPASLATPSYVSDPVASLTFWNGRIPEGGFPDGFHMVEAPQVVAEPTLAVESLPMAIETLPGEPLETVPAKRIRKPLTDAQREARNAAARNRAAAKATRPGVKAPSPRKRSQKPV